MDLISKCCIIYYYLKINIFLVLITPSPMWWILYLKYMWKCCHKLALIFLHILFFPSSHDWCIMVEDFSFCLLVFLFLCICLFWTDIEGIFNSRVKLHSQACCFMAWWLSCLDLTRGFWLLSEVCEWYLLSSWWSGLSFFHMCHAEV